MSELRKDPISRRWVIIASERGKRPTDFVLETALEPPGFDPFAEGNEDKTPHEIAAYRSRGTQPNKPGWRVRVVPNKYPALQVEGDLNKRGNGLYDGMRGIGAHEIIIETPKSVPTFTSLSDSAVQEILWMYRDRILDLRKDERLKYAMIFKNVGSKAGATMYHTHSQLIATPILPRTLALKMDACRDFMRFRERCLFCDIIAQETEQQLRIVMDTGQCVSFAPYAPRFPFETWILPKRHASHFEHIGKSEVEEFAFVLKRTLLKIEKGLGMPSYNLMLFSGPLQEGTTETFHWHMEVTPRIVPVAGFEWGTGFYINPVPPEDAAEFLRDLKV